MSRANKPRPIVAELGRPETDQEARERRAENSRLYRSRKTINNLILSLLVTLGLVVVIVFAVPRNDSERNWQVDYVSLTKQAQSEFGQKFVLPEVPAEWKANAAEVRRSSTGGVVSWYVGFITPSGGYIGFEDTFNGNPSWLSNLLKNYPSTGELTLGNRTWTVYDHRSDEKAGNAAYALVSTEGSRTVVLYGTATEAEFDTVAKAVSAQLSAAASAAASLQSPGSSQ